MIQAISQTNFDAFIETKANRIGNQGVGRTKHLVKFINDLDGAVFYAYPVLENIHPRYTLMPFFYNAIPNRFTGKINLKPAGYYKYEVYEVSWIGTVVLSKATAPSTETDVLPVHNDNGVVEGTGYTTAPTVTIAAPGTTGGHQATATCTVLAGAVNTVTITYAGSGYETNPIVTLTGGGFTAEATITATIEQTNYIYYGQ